MSAFIISLFLKKHIVNVSINNTEYMHTNHNISCIVRLTNIKKSVHI